MTSDDILSQTAKIIRTVLDNDAILVSPATSALDVPEWDSLSHVQLVVAVERHFKIRFSSAEIRSFKNVGEMCASIEKKLSVA